MKNTNSDRPLVTFALFAYNQEQYIREAVEGAFSQTYEPLEIILSDDCSTDRTFEAMQEMAAAYVGPHEVRVRRNGMNLGTIDHVITVAKEAKGELLVVAAGDDVSLPARTSQICAVWRDNRPFAIISNHDRISDSGMLAAKNERYEPLDRFQSFMETCTVAIRYDGKIRNIPGYCAAYNKKFIARTPLSGEKLFNEDSLFSYLINFEGGNIEYIDQSLLKVREARTSVTARKLHKASLAEISDRERKLEWGCYSKMRFYLFLFRICEDRNYKGFQSVRKKLHKDLLNNDFVVNYYSKPVMIRFASIVFAKNKVQRRFAAIRLFGIYSVWVLFRAQNIIERIKR